MIKDILNWLYTAHPNWKDRRINDISNVELLLWQNLMNEEIFETKQGVMTLDKKELIDGVVDIIWIALNIGAMAGVRAEDLEEYVEKVRASNYSKFCDNEQDAETTVFQYLTGNHFDKPGESIKSYYKKVGDKYVIFRQEDNKILKSFKYEKL